MTCSTCVAGPLPSPTARTAMSRSVIMPTRRSPAPTGRSPTSIAAIIRAASSTVWSGRTTQTSCVIACLAFMAFSLVGLGEKAADGKGVAWPMDGGCDVSSVAQKPQRECGSTMPHPDAQARSQDDLSGRSRALLPETVKSQLQELANHLDAVFLVAGGDVEMRRPDDGAGSFAGAIDPELGRIVGHRHRRLFHRIAIQLSRLIDFLELFDLPVALLGLDVADRAVPIAFAIDLRQRRMPGADIAKVANLPPKAFGIHSDPHRFDDVWHVLLARYPMR